MNLHSNLPARSRYRLKEYSLGAAAVATGAFGLAPQEAGATIIPFSDSGSFYQGTFFPNGDQATININLGDGSVLALDPGSFPDYLDFRVAGGLWDNSGGKGIGVEYPVASVLGANTQINPTAGFNFSDTANVIYAGTPQGAWASAFTDQYIGFSTSLGNEGYLKVSWDPGSGLFSYNGGAIENTGADLMTPADSGGGSVPEPGTLALLAAGAVGLARRRRASSVSA